MVFLYLSTALIVIAYYLYHHFTKYNNYWKERNIPGPEPVPFFGNVMESALRRQHPGKVFKNMYDSYPNEKVIGFFRMRTPTVLVRDLDSVKNVMIKDFDMFSDRGVSFSEKGLGANLFHANTDTWRVLRSRFTPLFTSGKLRNMLYLITERADKFIEYVEDITRENPIQEVHGLVQRYTQSTIVACAFGLDIDTIYSQSEDLNRIDKKIFTFNIGEELNMMYPTLLKKVGGSFFPKEVSTFFAELTKNILKNRNGTPSNRHDFMDLILELREKKQIEGPKKIEDDKDRILDITDEIISAQSFVFYAAGYETSASTMGFMLYLLAMHPEIQDKVINEIDEVLKKNNGQVTLESISELTYMSKVFDETLRMYPIGAILSRMAQDDYKLPGTNLVVEKGMSVMLSVLGIHYDEKHYPNPTVFDPERFSPENVAKRHSCAYMPFGLGPRNCIGMRFAQVQSKICILKLLSKFRVEPSKFTKANFEFSKTRTALYPEGGFQLKIVKRNNV